MANNTIGAKIELQGEAEYRKALKNIKTAQSELRSEMKLSQTQFKNNQNSVEALEKKQEILTRQLGQSAQKVEVCTKAVAEMSSKQNEAAQRVDKLQKEYEEADKALTALRNDSNTSTEALEKQQAVVNGLASELKRAESDYNAATAKVNSWQAALNYATEENVQLNDELKSNSRYLDEAKNSVTGTTRSIDEYGDEVEKAGNETNEFGEKIKANLTSQAIIAGVKALSGAIKEIATACIESGSAFEASMSNVKALSGATEDELEKLSNAARRAGENTVFSASEAADALGYMALAGWKTEEMVSGLEPVLNLAAAANTDLARTSDIVTDYLTAFGLTAQDAEKFTDQMAYAMANSNTTVDLLGESYKNCAATAHSMGISVEEVTAVLATMANAGVKGGEAGTALNSIMTRLATNTKECADQLAEYGVNVYDAYGNMNSLSDILEGMAGIWDTLTDKEQAALAKTIAGTNQYSKLQTIMSGLSEEVKAGGKSFADYRDALMDCNGTAKRMADTMQDNLKGKLKMLESAMESLKISTYDVFDETLKEGVDSATAAVKRLNDSVSNGNLNVSLNKLAGSIGDFTEKALDLGEKVLPGVIDGMAWLIDNAGTIAIGIGTIIAAQEAYKIATGEATIAQWALNVAMDANPVGLLVAGIVALTGAMAALYFATSNQTSIYEEEYKKTDKLIEANRELNDAINDNASSRKSAREASEGEATIARKLADELKSLQSSTTKSADSMLRQRMIVDELNEIMPSLNLAIDEQTGELNMSTKALDANIDAMMRQAKMEAAREDLTNIAKEQYEAEKSLYNLEKEKVEVTDKLAEAYANAAREENEYGRVTEDTQEASTYAKDALDELNAQIETTNESISSLNEEYAYTQEYLSDLEAVDAATGAFDEFGNAVDESGEKIQGMTTAALEALNEMANNVADVVAKQMSVFDEFDQKTEISKETLLNNMQSQIDGVTKWADNLEELADRGIDQGLLAHLAEMGPEGAAYAAAFVSMTDEELEKAAEMFGEAMTLPDEVASRVTESYIAAGENAVKGVKEGIETSTPDATDAAKEMAEATSKAVDDTLKSDGSTSSVMEEKGEVIPKSIAAGEKAKEKEVENATQEMAQLVPDTTDEVLKSDGSQSSVMEERGELIPESLGAGIDAKSDVPVSVTSDMISAIIDEAETLGDQDWESIGAQIPAGLAEGISKGESDVVNAIVDLCTEAVEAAKKELDINSPSKVFEWIGEMSGEGYIQGLTDRMVGVGNIIASTIPKAVANAQAQAGASGGRSVYQEINVYSPTDSLIDTARALKQSWQEAAMAW